jgi:transposase-like protein
VEKDDKIVVKNNNMTTIKNRKNYQSDFKAKVALEAVKGRLTINEISKQFGVHPNQVSKWKKQFLESLPHIFENSNKPPQAENEELTNQLYQQIGKLKVELDWLKKKSSVFD